MADDQPVVAPATCAACGRALAQPSLAHAWTHSTLLLGILAGVLYVGWGFVDEWSKIADFSIYSTPPGKADLLKQGLSFVAIVAVSAGLDVRGAITNGLTALGVLKGN